MKLDKNNLIKFNIKQNLTWLNLDEIIEFIIKLNYVQDVYFDNKTNELIVKHIYKEYDFYKVLRLSNMIDFLLVKNLTYSYI